MYPYHMLLSLYELHGDNRFSYTIWVSEPNELKHFLFLHGTISETIFPVFEFFSFAFPSVLLSVSFSTDDMSVLRK